MKWRTKYSKLNVSVSFERRNIFGDFLNSKFIVEKDVYGAVIHFDPTATVPQNVTITDCRSKKKEFGLQDKSNHLLDFKPDKWTTNCLEVIFGPEKYIHDANNDNIIVHLLYFNKGHCWLIESDVFGSE